MKVQIRLTEPYWRVVGQRKLHLELDKASSVSALLARLEKQYPDLSSEMKESPSILFINEEEAELDSLLEDGDQVHIVWPIMGG